MTWKSGSKSTANVSYSILLAGATGLVGRHCLRRLLADDAFERVVIPSRRSLSPHLRDLDVASKLEEHVVDFNRLSDHARIMRVDKVICALGTTMKKAGSRERFREVDFGYPAAIAELALDGGAEHFLVVSAMSANPKSFFFYSRVKGELEEHLRSLPYRSLTIARPSLLLGDREEFRFGEEAAKRVAFVIPGRYKPVHADQVAGALVDAAKTDRPGVQVIESREIRARAARAEA